MKPEFPEKVFVAGTGTGVGKTLVSAVLAEALQADYWKPVQTGSEDTTDSVTVHQLLSNKKTVIHPEAYLLKHPSAPHYAAALEGRRVDPGTIRFPESGNRLIVEGAGGLMVPLNEDRIYLDVMWQWQIPAVLVVRNYLGSINHALLSISALRDAGVPLLGVIFSGDNFLDNEEVIARFGKVPVLGKVEECTSPDAAFVQQQAALLRQNIKSMFHVA